MYPLNILSELRNEDKTMASKNYYPVVVHYSSTMRPNTTNCIYVNSQSYIQENQDSAWLNNIEYKVLFGKKRSFDQKNKLLAVLRLEYNDRVIRRRYKYDVTLGITSDQVGLTSESIRLLFDNQNASPNMIKVSKGNLRDVLLYYWDIPMRAERVAFRLGFVSVVLGVIALIISVISCVC